MKIYILTFSILFLLISQKINAQKDLLWSANDHFTLIEMNTEVKVKMEKMAWEAFTLIISEQDLSEYPSISFKVKSDVNIDLRVDILDKTNANLTQIPSIQKVSLGNDFVELTYDFREMKEVVDLTKIRQFQFFVNPGKKHTGTISIKDVVIGESVKNDLHSEKPLITFFPNPIIDQLTIQSKVKEFDEIRIIDALGKIVFSKKIPLTNQETFHLQKLPQGLFLFELRQDGKSIYTNSFTRQIF